MAPSKAECDALDEIVKIWRTDPRREKFEERLRNALRALCRGRLARNEVDSAESVLAELDREEKEDPKPNMLEVSDLLLLKAWFEAKCSHTERARIFLECTHCLVNSTGDYLHYWLQVAVKSFLPPSRVHIDN